MKNKTVFIDRDGTINIDKHYIGDPRLFHIYPGVGEGTKILKDEGYKIIVITNQSGIARGYFTVEDLNNVHKKMEDEFARFGVKFDAIYYCPHHPDEKCMCRKPNTALFEQAIKEHNVDVSRSFMIGDKELDIIAGKKMGLKTILVPEKHERQGLINNIKDWPYQPDYIADNFLKAVGWIRNRFKDESKEG